MILETERLTLRPWEESDNKMFGFGIGGFSQGHSSLEIRGDGDAYSYRHSASLLADTEERRGRWTSRRSTRPWHSSATSAPAIAARIGGGPQWKQDATSCTT